MNVLSVILAAELVLPVAEVTERPDRQESRLGGDAVDRHLHDVRHAAFDFRWHRVRPRALRPFSADARKGDGKMI